MGDLVLPPTYRASPQAVRIAHTELEGADGRWLALAATQPTAANAGPYSSPSTAITTSRSVLVKALTRRSESLPMISDSTALNSG